MKIFFFNDAQKRIPDGVLFLVISCLIFFLFFFTLNIFFYLHSWQIISDVHTRGTGTFFLDSYGMLKNFLLIENNWIILIPFLTFEAFHRLKNFRFDFEIWNFHGVSIFEAKLVFYLMSAGKNILLKMKRVCKSIKISISLEVHSRPISFLKACCDLDPNVKYWQNRFPQFVYLNKS